MYNIKPLLKRAAAYAIDILIIIIVASWLSNISFLNPKSEEYQKTYMEYEDLTFDYMNYTALLEEYYKDKKIDEEEYTTLIENSNYKELYEKAYEDNTISQKEYSNILSEINNNFDNIAKDYLYLLGKQNIYTVIITLICTLLYFGILQYFLKGQTIGKKILKLQVVSSSNKKITILNYILRTILLNEILLYGISISVIYTIIISFTSKSVYLKTNNIIGIVMSIVEAIIIYLVLTREDQRSIHDLLFNTKVISTDTDKESLQITFKDKKVIEAKVEEQKKTEKKKNTKSKKQ